MGRRIPKSRRHKKLKFVDPSYRGPQPRSKKNKRLQFNEPPENDDVQEVPRGMEEFIDLRNRVKDGKIKKRKKKKKTYQNDFIVVKNQIVDKTGSQENKIVKTMPKEYKQSKTETEHQFINRLQNIADKALAEAKVEEKYNIKLVSIDKNGNAVYKSLDDEKNETKKKEKRQKYREKIQEKKRQKDDDEEFELKKDNIQFGDIVSAPPNLTTKPRKALESSSKRPGRKELKLKSMLPKSAIESLKKVVKSSKSNNSKTPEEKREMENERARAVQMYRLLKSKRT